LVDREVIAFTISGNWASMPDQNSFSFVFIKSSLKTPTDYFFYYNIFSVKARIYFNEIG
jgi:hypothetical protein